MTDRHLSTATGQSQKIDELLTSTNTYLYELTELVKKTEAHLSFLKADGLVPPPDILDGTECKAHFEQWRARLLKKLTHRAEALHLDARKEESQMDYVLSRLSGCALQAACSRISSFNKTGEKQKIGSVEEVVDELQRFFSMDRKGRMNTQKEMFGNDAS